MRHILSITVLLFILHFLVGCQSIKEPEQKYDGTKPVRTVIAGKVIDPPEDNETLMFIINDLPTARQLIDYSYIDLKDSTFKFVIERYLPQDIMIKYGQLFSVLVHPGDSLFITIDGKKINKNDFKYNMLKFSGEPAEFNKLLQKYLAEDLEKNRMDFKKFIRFQERCTAEEIKHYADSVRKINLII